MKHDVVLKAMTLAVVISLGCLIPAASSGAAVVGLDLVETEWELRPGLSTGAWSYNGQVPGTMITVEAGVPLVVEGANRLPVSTNIRWHGLEVPNGQDGPGKVIRSGDHVLVLDDWYLDARERRIEGTAPGGIERYGNVETVNGKTYPAIEPLLFKKRELHKLRFVNASTAAFH